MHLGGKKAKRRPRGPPQPFPVGMSEVEPLELLLDAAGEDEADESLESEEAENDFRDPPERRLQVALRVPLEPDRHHAADRDEKVDRKR